MLSSNEGTILREVKEEIESMASRQRKIIEGSENKEDGIEGTTIEKLSAHILAGYLTFIGDSLGMVIMLAGFMDSGLDMAYRVKRILILGDNRTLWKAFNQHDVEPEAGSTLADGVTELTREDVRRTLQQKPEGVFGGKNYYVSYPIAPESKNTLQVIADQLKILSSTFKPFGAKFSIFTLGPIPDPQKQWVFEEMIRVHTGLTLTPFAEVSMGQSIGLLQKAMPPIKDEEFPVARLFSPPNLLNPDSLGQQTGEDAPQPQDPQGQTRKSET